MRAALLHGLCAGLVLLGAELGALGCGGGTAEVSTEAVELPPADPRAVREFRAGNRAMSRGGTRNDRRALDAFKRAVEIDPYLWEAFYNMGVCYRRLGETREAITAFENARRIQPGAAEPLLALAEAQWANGDRDEASQLLRAYVSDVDPNAVDVRVAYATLLREQGEHDDALEQAREALIRQPQNVEALVEVGRVYQSREQWDVAALVFRKALELSPEGSPQRAAIHNDLGLVALARGDTQAAFVELARAVEIDPRNKDAHKNQGSVLLRAGDFAGAAAEYEAVLRIDEEDLDARVAYGICLRGTGDNNRARREYERVLDEAPNHPAALYNLAVLKFAFLNQLREARPLFQRFLEVAPSDAPQRAEAERYLQEITMMTQQQPGQGGRRRGGGGGE